MSATISFSFEIHNINEIHEEEDEIKRDESYEAARTFLEKEGLFIRSISMAEQSICIDFLGSDGYLAAYSTEPVIISSPRSDNWIGSITKRWEEMAFSVLGTSCKPLVKLNYID